MSDSNDGDQEHVYGTTEESELLAAIREGDPLKILRLIEAGADIHYKRRKGYDALIDAVHSKVVDDDSGLLELLALLIAQGVELSGVSSYGESGLRVLSRRGRFDAVRMLLEAGADKTQLCWTPLIEAVALGSLADVRRILETGAMLEAKDCWERRSVVDCIVEGGLRKGKVAVGMGRGPERAQGVRSPADILRHPRPSPRGFAWLLREGMDVCQTDDFGNTALIEAVGNDDLDCVQILLEAGANVAVDAGGTALSRASSREIIMCLLDAGADPADANQRVILCLRDLADDALAAVSPNRFQRHLLGTSAEVIPN